MPTQPPAGGAWGASARYWRSEARQRGCPHPGVCLLISSLVRLTLRLIVIEARLLAEKARAG